MLVIPKFTKAIGTVTEAKPKRSLGKGGKLNVNIDYLRLPDGDKLALRGVQDTKGGGHTGAMTGAMVASAIVFWPAAPLFLLMKGKDITIPKGHEITVYTNSEYDLPYPKPKVTAVVEESASPVRILQETMANADVVHLKEIGLGDDLIVRKIRSSPANYRLGIAELMALKSAGISDQVIGAMFTAQASR